MFGFFKIRNATKGLNESQEKIAKIIVNKALHIQEKWADFMSRKTKNLSLKSIKLLLIVFSFFTGSISIYLIFKSANSSDHLFKIKTFLKTPGSTQNRDGNTTQMIIETKDFERIKKFRSYLDSLDTSNEGRKIRERILGKRPGLLDSILQLEQLFNLQKPLKK